MKRTLVLLFASLFVIASGFLSAQTTAPAIAFDSNPMPLAFQHIGILSLEFHVDKLSRPLL